MTLQSINAQSLRPAVNFKAETEAAPAVATTTVANEKPENKHTAAKIVGGLAALALLGFGIYKLTKGDTNTVKQIKEGVKEYTTKNGNKIRIYESPQNGRLTVVKNKDGKITKMIRTKPINLNPKAKEESVDLDKAFREALEEARDKSGIPRHLQPPIGEVRAPKIGEGSAFTGRKPDVKIPVQPEYVTTVKDYVKKDGTISEKPVFTIITGNSAEGKYRYITSPLSDYNNVVTTAKDGTKTLEIFNRNGDEIASVKYQKGKILESKGMDAKFDEKGQLIYELK